LWGIVKKTSSSTPSSGICMINDCFDNDSWLLKSKPGEYQTALRVAYWRSSIHGIEIASVVDG
jgi:hypothetical protein